MKIQIVTHLLPHELDEFEQQLCVLSQNVITDDEIILDVTLNLNAINWEKTSIPKNFFIDKFNLLSRYVTKTSWCKQYLFDVDESGKCRGINDKRRNSIRKYSDSVDAFLYLDSDLVFPSYALPYIIHCAKQIKNKYYIVTPQTTKLWDSTWDHLVNSKFIDASYGTEKVVNPYVVANQSGGDVKLIVSNPIKMGGGWFNLISSNLLKHTDIPDVLGPYGVDDTYVMFCAQIMQIQKIDVNQYIMENIVVAENYLLRENVYKNYINYKEGKFDFKKNAEMNLRQCLIDFKTKYEYFK